MTLTPPANSTLSVNESQSAEIVCNATGNPKPTISWTKDGMPLPSHIMSVKQDGGLILGTIRTVISTLNISYATFADTGDYQCIASFMRLGVTKRANKFVRLEVQGQWKRFWVETFTWVSLSNVLGHGVYQKWMFVACVTTHLMCLWLWVTIFLPS